MAARGARAAGPHAYNRPAVAGRCAARVSPHGVVSAGTARIGFGRGPERSARAALRATRSPTASRARRRAGAVESGCNFHRRRSRGPCRHDGDDTHSHDQRRHHWRRAHGKSLAAWRQHHRRHHSAPELSAKRLEVLRDIIPGLSRVTALHDPTNGTSQVAMAESAAGALNVKLQVVDIKNREDVGRAIRAARDTQAQALNIFFSPLLSALHREIITLAAEYGLPAIYQWKEHVEAGGLVSYGPNLAAMWRQSAVIIGKVLKGAKPADVPVEQPTKLELVVNFRTAKSLGLTIPPSVLLRADEVIE